MTLGVRIVDIDIPATILAIAALATAIGVPAWVNARRSRKAVVAAKDATAEVIAAVKPTNGSDTLADEIKEQFDQVKRSLDSLGDVVDANAITTRLMAQQQEAHGHAIGEIRTRLTKLEEDK